VERKQTTQDNTTQGAQRRRKSSKRPRRRGEEAPMCDADPGADLEGQKALEDATTEGEKTMIEADDRVVNSTETTPPSPSSPSSRLPPSTLSSASCSPPNSGPSSTARADTEDEMLTLVVSEVPADSGSSDAASLSAQRQETVEGFVSPRTVDDQDDESSPIELEVVYHTETPQKSSTTTTTRTTTTI